MSDEALRGLEREARGSGDPALLDRLIAEQRRARQGRFHDLTQQLTALQAHRLPVLRAEQWLAGGLLLRELDETWRDRLSDPFALLDRVVVERLPDWFEGPVALLAPRAPGVGWTPAPPPDGDEDPEALEAWHEAQDAHHGQPTAWAEHTLPVRDEPSAHVASGDRSPEAEDSTPPWMREPTAPTSVRDLVEQTLRWSINDKEYRVQRADGTTRLVAFSHAPGEAGQIERQEAELRVSLRRLVTLLLDGLGPTTRAFTSAHVLSRDSAAARGWELQRDRIVMLLDEEHVRFAWAVNDRYYG